MTGLPRSASRQIQDSRVASRLAKSIEEWDSLFAYVLLGDPGSGKSWALIAESTRVAGLLVKAQDICDGVAIEPKLEQIVFIDALDEIKANSSDQSAMGTIRKWIHDRPNRKFRLACREADWRSDVDKAKFTQFTPDIEIVELHLDTFTEQEQIAALQLLGFELSSAQSFITSAKTNSIDGLLGNPLLLSLFASVIARGGDWPKSKTALYEAACNQLATESSPVHSQKTHLATGLIPNMIEGSGFLMALMLISGSPSINAIKLNEWQLQIPNLEAILKSNLFSSESGSYFPRHRSIAEYLGGKALANRINQGLPIGRVLAVICAVDGKPLQALRGLFAWTVIHLTGPREQLISIDPLALALNGDVVALAVAEKKTLLLSLERAVSDDPWLMKEVWITHPLGNLVGPEMSSTFTNLIKENNFGDGRQRFLWQVVFEALLNGLAMPELADTLYAYICNPRVQFAGRSQAYRCWERCVDKEKMHTLQLSLLDLITKNVIVDEYNWLLGHILSDLYPDKIDVQNVSEYLRKDSEVHFIGRYWYFLKNDLLNKSTPEDIRYIVNEWPSFSQKLDQILPPDEVLRFAGKAVAKALVNCGDTSTDEQLYSWLNLPVDRNWSSGADHKDLEIIADWFSNRPEVVKRLAAYELERRDASDSAAVFSWQLFGFLRGTTLPKDFFVWLLKQVTRLKSDELAREVFFKVASLPLDPKPEFDIPSLEQIESVEAENHWRTDAKKWLERFWYRPLGEWEQTYHLEEKTRRLKVQEQLNERALHYAPFLQSLISGVAPISVLAEVANAYMKRFSDIKSHTEEKRVAELLVTDESVAQSVIANFSTILNSVPLPSASELLKLRSQGKRHLGAPAFLLAADLAIQETADAFKHWSDDLAGSLCMMYLLDSAVRSDVWFYALMLSRPRVLAPILTQYILRSFQKKWPTELGHFQYIFFVGANPEIIPLILPEVLEEFPEKASQFNRRDLNATLLPALAHVNEAAAKKIINAKLANKKIDSMQRLSWLVRNLAYEESALDALIQFVGQNQLRARELLKVLHEQDHVKFLSAQLSETTLGSLIEHLGAFKAPQLRESGVQITDQESKTIEELIARLGDRATPVAQKELTRLYDHPRLSLWREDLLYTRRNQSLNLRESQFKTPSIAKIVNTLSGSNRPANQADMQAIFLDLVRNFETEARNGNSNTVRQFYRTVVGAGKTEAIPKVENDCRDLILDLIKPRIEGFHIQIDKETVQFGESRADIKLTLSLDQSRLTLPIEIKKDDSRELWVAQVTQLQQKYAIEPSSASFGIYLVLWFGHKTQANPSGVKPTSAAELASLLAAQVAPDDRAKIKICVVDLSK
jgi:hypothetical protein